MLSERTKRRLAPNRPVTTVRLRMPVDVGESLNAIASLKGFSGYQTLLRAYISEGLRHDDALFADGRTNQAIEAFKKWGVPEFLIDEAARELA
jgi:hypothetical protein